MNRILCFETMLFRSKRAQAVVLDSVFLKLMKLLAEISDKLVDSKNVDNSSSSDVVYSMYGGSGKDIGRKKENKKKKENENKLKINGHSLDLPYNYVEEKEDYNNRNKDDPLTFLKNTKESNKLGFESPEIKKLYMDKFSQQDLEAVQSNAEFHRKNLPGSSKFSWKNLAIDTGHLFNSIYDNTIGYGIAKSQNFRSRRDLKKNKDKPIMYLMNGIVVNEGSQHRLAKKLKKKGFIPYHLPASHLLNSKEKILDKSYKRIKKLHKYAGITDEEVIKRKDGFSGHSDGGNFVNSYLANNLKTRDLGIKWAQSRAASTYGVDFKNTPQKLLKYFIPQLKREDIRKKEGKELATKNYLNNPVIPIYTFAGERDRLIPPKYSHYIKEEKYNLLKGKNTTHFATSGASNSHNEILAREAKNIYDLVSGKGNYYIRG